MLIGSILNEHTDSVYSQTINRGGITGNFAVDLMQISTTTSTLSIEVQHRNIEDLSWTSVAAFPDATDVGLMKVEARDLKELVRLALDINGGSGNDWVRVYVVPTSWTNA